ncbi:GntR family transcriptional regulator [Haloferula chungangensis]|uniref:GntR family transcriptional regulator n=2 Tax=Haloferula chungangensis TaxID=1048331 RepID=A0ABW2LCW2_9BACT
MLVYRTMREQITERIRSEVLSQELSAGTSLREQALAERYGVSRAPVRDALLQLSNEGLLVAKPNCGVKVAALPDKTLQPLIIRIRRDIEAVALGKLFERHGDVNFEPFREVLEEFRLACESGKQSAVVQCDMAFHRFILAASGEQELLSLWLPIVSRMMLNYARHKDWMESYREHEAIFNAILAKDLPLASELLANNVS